MIVFVRTLILFLFPSLLAAVGIVIAVSGNGSSVRKALAAERSFRGLQLVPEYLSNDVDEQGCQCGRGGLPFVVRFRRSPQDVPSRGVEETAATGCVAIVRPFGVFVTRGGRRRWTTQFALEWHPSAWTRNTLIHRWTHALTVNECGRRVPSGEIRHPNVPFSF